MSLFVYVTTPDPACAERIGLLLLESHLAAGINILPPVRSMYWWQGAIERTEECAFIAQTDPDRFAALADAVRAEHPYTCPCIVALPITEATPDFRAWITASTRPE